MAVIMLFCYKHPLYIKALFFFTCENIIFCVKLSAWLFFSQDIILLSPFVLIQIDLWEACLLILFFRHILVLSMCVTESMTPDRISLRKDEQMKTWSRGLWSSSCLFFRGILSCSVSLKHNSFSYAKFYELIHYEILFYLI